MYSNTINVIGAMSGTSLDGLDLCLVSFDSNNYSNFKILNSSTGSKLMVMMCIK